MSPRESSELHLLPASEQGCLPVRQTTAGFAAQFSEGTSACGRASPVAVHVLCDPVHALAEGAYEDKSDW
jgi:hypothetical protein